MQKRKVSKGHHQQPGHSHGLLQSGLKRDTWPCSLRGSRPTSALYDGGPILPLFGDFGEDVAHHFGGGHEPVSLTLEDAHLTTSHGLAEPLDILNGHASILAAVVDDSRPCDVHIPEPDRLAPFQTHQEIHCRVGIGSGESPDVVCQSGVVVTLSFQLILDSLCRSVEGRIAMSVRFMPGIGRFKGLDDRRRDHLGWIELGRRSHDRMSWTILFGGVVGGFLLRSSGRLWEAGGDAGTRRTQKACIGYFEERRRERTEDPLRVGHGIRGHRVFWGPNAR